MKAHVHGVESSQAYSNNRERQAVALEASKGRFIHWAAHIHTIHCGWERGVHGGERRRGGREQQRRRNLHKHSKETFVGVLIETGPRRWIARAVFRGSCVDVLFYIPCLWVCLW